MKKHIFIVLIVSISIMLARCSNPHEFSSDSIKTIKIDLDKAIEEISIKEVFSNIRMVKLETHPDAIFDEANKVVTTPDHIYISDGSSIILFTIDGTFQKKLRNRGRGPGEYSGISDFIIDETNKKIEILDTRRQKVLIYDLDFQYIGEYIIDRYSMNFAMLDNNVRLFHCGNDDSGNAQNKKILVYNDGTFIDDFLTIDMNRSRFLHYRRFDYFSYYKNNLIVTDSHCDTIYNYNGEFFQPKYIIDIGSKSIPKKVYSAKNYSDIAEFTTEALMGSGYAFGIFNCLESDNMLYFRYQERYKDSESPFGKLVYTSVIYCKQTQSNKVSNVIIDDYNFQSSPEINRFTTFFSQTNGDIAYVIPAYEFIEMYKEMNFNAGKNNRAEQKIDSRATELFLKTAPYDNHILFIANLR